MQGSKHERDVSALPEQTKQNAPPVLFIKIDRTTYKVRLHFSKTSAETFGDKIARLIKSETENQISLSAKAAATKAASPPHTQELPAAPKTPVPEPTPAPAPEPKPVPEPPPKALAPPVPQSGLTARKEKK